MRKTIFFGYEYFCKKLVNQLTEYDKENKYVFVSTNTFFNKLLAVYEILISNNIFIIGGSIYGSKIIDLALLFNKKIFIEWVGTDILIASENYKNGFVNKDYIKKCVHLCEVGWTQEELKQIGINAKICDIVTISSDECNNHKICDDGITVFSYIAQNREDFYGIELILKLAELYPNIKFRIAGTTGVNCKQLNNVKYLGWINNMNVEYDNCDIFMRLVQHDGLAFSVIEALSRGKWVIYSYPFNYVQTYNNFDELKSVFDKLLQKIKNEEVNNKAKNFIFHRYEKENILYNIIKILGVNLY